MAIDALVDYIKNARALKQLDNEIFESLKKSGWGESDIKEAFVSIDGVQAEASTVPSPLTSRPDIYPTINIQRPETSSRFLNFPLFGLFIKFLLLIPHYFVLIFVYFYILILFLINPFYILFTGKFMRHAYEIYLGSMRWGTKIFLYLYGITDKYPDFSFKDVSPNSIAIDMPSSPNRFLNFPILFLLIKGILLIPYSIFQGILNQGAFFSYFFASFAILFTGKYPESLFEFNRDSLRVTLSLSAYFSGLKDKYPSFWISMNNSPIKVILIILGAITYISNMSSNFTSNKFRDEMYGESSLNKYENSVKVKDYRDQPQDVQNMLKDVNRRIEQGEEPYYGGE